MASLKRYRQTTESNAAARFRDLPPRFKRQKSVPSTESNNADSQKESEKQKKSLAQGFSVTNQINNSFRIQADTTRDSLNSKDKKILKRGAANRPHLNVDRNLGKKSTLPIVLSPMDNNLFNFSRNDELSSVENTNHLSLPSQQPLPWPTSYKPVFEQIGISSANTSFSDGSWNVSPNLHQTKEISHNQSAPFSYSEVTSEQPKDYSETDKRIIEMFKELERVADQKEKEESENGSDRKTLVSHHLRMLMCAIDKYTEGIDDETDLEDHVDEVQTGENSSFPLGQDSVQPSVSSKGDLDINQSFQPHNAGVTSTTEIPVPTSTPVFVHNTHTPPPIVYTDMYQQVYGFSPPFIYGKSSEVSSKVKPWDLWSSPSFNGLDVFYKGHNSSETADSTFVLFDQLGMESDDYNPRAEEFLTRTPLYKR